jgi:hypothetical protein
LHGISLFELERRLKMRQRRTARIPREFCSGLHLLDVVDMGGFVVCVDSDACGFSARVSAVLRSVLFTRVLQCPTETFRSGSIVPRAGACISLLTSRFGPGKRGPRGECGRWFARAGRRTGSTAGNNIIFHYHLPRERISANRDRQRQRKPFGTRSFDTLLST